MTAAQLRIRRAGFDLIIESMRLFRHGMISRDALRLALVTLADVLRHVRDERVKLGIVEADYIACSKVIRGLEALSQCEEICS